jgi:hypothetical protein
MNLLVGKLANELTGGQIGNFTNTLGMFGWVPCWFVALPTNVQGEVGW